VFDPDAPDARLGTHALVTSLVEWIDAPVIAAGGIMDGAGIYEVMRLGAAAAQLGTAFVGCDESLADAGYRAALFSTRETVMTRAISGRPARCLVNRFTAIDGTDAPAYPVAYDLGKALAVAARGKGEPGFGAQWAGTGVASARKGSAAEIVGALVAELERT
jgi:nitronate monooxygenase